MNMESRGRATGAHFLRDARETDYPAVLELNQANMPHVSSLDFPALKALARQAEYFRISLIQKRICGFLLALPPSADYASLNFHWFRKRYDDFVYIDRIVVGTKARRTGLGFSFYRDLERIAQKNGVARLACEYNLDPPNEISAQFHKNFGFFEVGTQKTEGGKKTVSLQIKPLLSK